MGASNEHRIQNIRNQGYYLMDHCQQCIQKESADVIQLFHEFYQGLLSSYEITPSLYHNQMKKILHQTEEQMLTYVRNFVENTLKEKLEASLKRVVQEMLQSHDYCQMKKRYPTWLVDFSVPSVNISTATLLSDINWNAMAVKIMIDIQKMIIVGSIAQVPRGWSVIIEKELKDKKEALEQTFRTQILQQYDCITTTLTTSIEELLVASPQPMPPKQEQPQTKELYILTKLQDLMKENGLWEGHTDLKRELATLYRRASNPYRIILTGSFNCKAFIILETLVYGERMLPLVSEWSNRTAVEFHYGETFTITVYPKAGTYFDDDCPFTIEPTKEQLRFYVFDMFDMSSSREREGKKSFLPSEDLKKIIVTWPSDFLKKGVALVLPRIRGIPTIPFFGDILLRDGPMHDMLIYCVDTFRCNSCGDRDEIELLHALGIRADMAFFYPPINDYYTDVEEMEGCKAEILTTYTAWLPELTIDQYHFETVERRTKYDEEPQMPLDIEAVLAAHVDAQLVTIDKIIPFQRRLCEVLYLMVENIGRNLDTRTQSYEEINVLLRKQTKLMDLAKRIELLS